MSYFSLSDDDSCSGSSSRDTGGGSVASPVSSGASRVSSGVSSGTSQSSSSSFGVYKVLMGVKKNSSFATYINIRVNSKKFLNLEK